MAHEAQVRYSHLVDLKLRKTLVKKVGVICNNRYEGSPKAGSVKVPVRDTEVAVNDYDKQKGAKQTSGDTSYLTVTIDKDKAVKNALLPLQFLRAAQQVEDLCIVVDAHAVLCCILSVHQLRKRHMKRFAEPLNDAVIGHTLARLPL